MRADLLELIEATKIELGLSEFVIEKDYYVTEVLNILSKIKNEYFNLIFCGGTCLAKAHKTVKRMSEDVDFKFQRKAACDGFSKTKYLKALKEFRTQIVASLQKTDFTFSYEKDTRYSYPHAMQLLEKMSGKVIDSIFAKVNAPQ